jgi:hypothetical protein
MRAASNYRDLAIVLNYDLAASGTKTPAENADRSQTASHGSPSILAAGGIRLPGLQMGDYRENLLAGLQTGWMRMPAVKKQDEDNPRAAVDLSVYVVESAPGNPLLQSIGAYLAGEPFAAKVEGALQGELSN